MSDHRGHAGAAHARGNRRSETRDRLSRRGELRAAPDRRARAADRHAEPERPCFRAAGSLRARARAALGAALKLALRTIDGTRTANRRAAPIRSRPPPPGAVGGAFGLGGAAGRAAALDRDRHARRSPRSPARRARISARPPPRSPASRCSRSAERRRRPPSRAAISPSAPRSPSRSARAPAFSRARGSRPVGAGGGSSPHPDRRAVRRDREREGGGPGRPDSGRDRRRSGQRRLRLAFPDAGARPFHRAPARAAARRQLIAFEYRRLKGEAAAAA